MNCTEPKRYTACIAEKNKNAQTMRPGAAPLPLPPQLPHPPKGSPARSAAPLQFQVLPPRTAATAAHPGARQSTLPATPACLGNGRGGNAIEIHELPLGQ